MTLNVNRAVSDPFYRYKMPRLLAKVEGKGNGIKTVIANMTEIAKSLERPPTYPTKYFGCELGAQTQVDVKNERYIVNGEHDASKLQDILDGFIKKFVLCPSCDNPETTLTVRRNQINSKCKACGHAFIIDPKHRLSTFIIKNPPKIEIDFSLAKEKKASNGTTTQGEDLCDSKNGSTGDEDDDGDWAEPTEDERLAANIGKLVISKDLEKSTEERLDMLHSFFQEKITKNEVDDGKILADEAERLDLKQKAPLLLANVLFNENIVAEKQIEKYRKVLLRFTLQDQKAQRYLLGGIEQLIVSHEDVLIPKAAHIVKALYDNDVCVEDAILAWGEKATSKFVQKSKAKKILEVCEKFLIWLREADEESSEDEDDEIHFDTVKKSAIAEKLAEKAKEELTAVEVDGEEIDLDAI